MLEKGEFKQVARKLAYLGVRIIMEQPCGEMRKSDLIQEIDSRIKNGRLRLPSDFLKEVTPKSGDSYPQWRKQLEWMTSDYAVLGFLEKPRGGEKRGVWRLTDNGKKLLAKPEDTVIEEVARKYAKYLDDKNGAQKP